MKELQKYRKQRRTKGNNSTVNGYDDIFQPLQKVLIMGATIRLKRCVETKAQLENPAQKIGRKSFFSFFAYLPISPSML